MLLIQGLLGLIRRSAGKVIQSIFGWAVSALFGDVQKNEKTLLAAVVGAVALWPVLLAGIAFPRVAVFVLTLAPLPKWISGGALRIVWISLALLVPFAVGIVVQRREGIREWGWKNFVAGFPLTLGISSAFTVAFFALPFQKLAAALRGMQEEHITLIAEEGVQEDVVREVRLALDRDGLGVRPERPPWMARTIAAILKLTAAVVGKDTGRPLFFRGPDLELTIYPHGATVRGLPRATARAHAVIAATATHTAALQTTDPSAQKVERKIKAAWNGAGSGRSRGSDILFERIARDVSRLDCPYEDWEVVYRQCLQLRLARHGFADPVAERPGARLESDPARRRGSRRFGRARRLTKENAAATAANRVSKLAERVAKRLLGHR